MIKNQKQLAVAEKEIGALKASIQELDNENKEAALDFKDQMQLSIFQGRLNDLISEVEEYKNLTSNQLEVLNFNESEIVKAIVSFRIASGLTQKELADKLEIQEQQIQRYEQNDYLTASFDRVIQILKTLNIEVNLQKKLKRKPKVKFLISHRDKVCIPKTIGMVTERKQLVSW